MHPQGLKEKSGPCATMTEVSKICLDEDSFNCAAMMLQNFRLCTLSLNLINISLDFIFPFGKTRSVNYLIISCVLPFFWLIFQKVRRYVRFF